ncbi:MAG: LuxR C-terminal-related transcriptional regulator [Elainellaceae cyanobacterium]
MPLPLKLLFEEIDQTKDEDDLRSQLAPKIGEYFLAKRSAIFFFNRLKVDPRFQNVVNAALSLENNPVVRYLAERHAPVHEELVTSPKTWAVICPRPDHWHVMAGPIISRGQLIGSVGCTREKAMPAFNTQDLADMSAICLHLSVWMATGQFAQVATSAPQHQPSSTRPLTPRELQIAALVALGRTNAEIGHELWITENSVKQALKRMFRKLKVSSRTEMVARLASIQNHISDAKLSSSNLMLDTHQ